MVEKQFVFINKLFHILIKKGKKAKALKVFLYLLKELKHTDIKGLTPIEIIYQSLLNVRPLVYVTKVRKSSKIFYLPQIISTEKKINIALHWILDSVNKRKEKQFKDRLVNEFMDCFFSKGSTMLKKQNLYSTINVNRPFLHLLIYK